MSGPLAALYPLRQWSPFYLRPVPKKPKPDKVPIFQTNKPELWIPKPEAVTLARRRGLPGVGLLLGGPRSLAGVDVDETGTNPTAKTEATLTMARDLGAYIEPSLNGDGYHVLGVGSPIGFQVKGDDVIRWENGRWFVTLDNGQGNPVVDIGPLPAMLDSLVPPKPAMPAGPRQGYAFAAETSDEDILYQAAGAANGETFLSLWKGDASGYKSHSEADLALCGLLAFWTDHDAARIERLFQQSKLYRPGKPASYLRATIRKARQ